MSYPGGELCGMTRAKDRALAEFAAANHSVFSTTHAISMGFTKGERAHRIESGQWVALFDHVFRLAGVPRSWKGDLLAACWAGGFRAVASHRSAAALWDLAGARRNIVEITCPRWRRAQHDGLVVHETKRLDPADLTVVGCIPVTRPELTLLHLAAVCHPSAVEMAFDAAERRELVTRGSLEALVRRLGKQGRNGIGTLRELLERHDPAQKPRHSEMETLVLQVLRRNGLPVPVTQYEIRRGNGAFVAQVDAAYPEWMVAIEYDSYEWHTGRSRLEKDTHRRLSIQRARWSPVTATASNLRGDGREFVEAILASRRTNSSSLLTPKP
jgi:hypothetical protein